MYPWTRATLNAVQQGPAKLCQVHLLRSRRDLQQVTGALCPQGYFVEMHVFHQMFLSNRLSGKSFFPRGFPKDFRDSVKIFLKK